jgi:hypothetical protein
MTFETSRASITPPDDREIQTYGGIIRDLDMRISTVFTVPTLSCALEVDTRRSIVRSWLVRDGTGRIGVRAISAKVFATNRDLIGVVDIGTG